MTDRIHLILKIGQICSDYANCRCLILCSFLLAAGWRLTLCFYTVKIQTLNSGLCSISASVSVRDDTICNGQSEIIDFINKTLQPLSGQTCRTSYGMRQAHKLKRFQLKEMQTFSNLKN